MLPFASSECESRELERDLAYMSFLCSVSKHAFAHLSGQRRLVANVVHARRLGQLKYIEDENRRLLGAIAWAHVDAQVLESTRCLREPPMLQHEQWRCGPHRLVVVALFPFGGLINGLREWAEQQGLSGDTIYWLSPRSGRTYGRTILSARPTDSRTPD